MTRESPDSRGHAHEERAGRNLARKNDRELQTLPFVASILVDALPDENESGITSLPVANRKSQFGILDEAKAESVPVTAGRECPEQWSFGGAVSPSQSL